MFACPQYYYHHYSNDSSAVAVLPKEDAQGIEDAIRAMEAWNTDLTWFIFQRESHSYSQKEKQHSRLRLPERLERFNTGERLGGRLKFATMGLA
jgi:hypothetical protein